MPSVVFRDIDLNFAAHPNTNKLLVSEGEVAVKRALGYLLRTNKGDRLFHPEIGSNINRLLFENVTASTAMDVKSVIEEAIRNYEPRVLLDEIFVDPQLDRNGYSVTIRFTILNQNIPQSLSLFLERLR